MDEPNQLSQVRRMVAQYVRMSTEHQQYSTENQSVAILQYAQSQNLEIVRTYSDHGKSGLSLVGRSGLQQLLYDVKTGDVDFTAVLVYDVSRWGRFQNPDQGASYEYSLTSAGVPVHYCAEQFHNDGSLSSALLKTVKRGMAGEYSRELSVKVWAGQRRLIELGFRQGGPAGYGLCRHLIDQNKNFKQVLYPGDRKSLQTDRVVLVPGSAVEVEVVQQIYKWFLEEHLGEAAIADLLNLKNISAECGRTWTRDMVHTILTNHKYIGYNVYNRHSFKLKQKRVNNPPEAWICKTDAFEPLVPLAHFEEAQALIAARKYSLSNAEMLESLSSLLKRKGRLSAILIDECEDMAPSKRYAARFGSLIRAYSLVGWTSDRDYSFIDINRAIRKQHENLISSICANLNDSGANVIRDSETDLLKINGEYSASLVLARCQTLPSGHRWKIRFDTALKPDITIAARLTADNETVLDYYLLPGLAEMGNQLRLSHENPLSLEIFRFDNLDFFNAIARRSSIAKVA